MTSSVSRTPAEATAHADLRAEMSDLRSEVERLAAEVAEMRAHASNLEALAHEDPLTGALNRRGFERELARAIAYRTRYGTPVALMVGDLDRFKPINDTHGHEIGDRALAHLATLLRRNIRASDTLGRLGGDEFALIVWQVDEAAAAAKARTLSQIVTETPLALAARTIPLGLSLGVTMLAERDTARDALHRADQAMYAQKAARKAAR